MPNLIAAETEKYQSAWALDAYAKNSPGASLVPLFLDMAKPQRGSVLDAGCGSGKGAVALANEGFAVTMCDLTPDGLTPESAHLPFQSAVLWKDLRPVARQTGREWFDYAYCCDVLEHIPTSFSMLVISRLLDVSKHGVFLSISTVHDEYGSFIGEPLHQTVKPFVWWRDQIGALARVVEARDLLINACFWVKAS